MRMAPLVMGSQATINSTVFRGAVWLRYVVIDPGVNLTTAAVLVDHDGNRRVGPSAIISIFGCVVLSSSAVGIGMYNVAQLDMRDNVVVGAFESALRVQGDTQTLTLVHNLFLRQRPATAVAQSTVMSTQLRAAVFIERLLCSMSVRQNLIAGADEVGLMFAGSGCSNRTVRALAELLTFEVHSAQYGVVLASTPRVQTDIEDFPTWVSGVSVWQCSRIGLLGVDLFRNVVLRGVVVAGCAVGVSLNFIRQGSSNVARIEDSLILAVPPFARALPYALRLPQSECSSQGASLGAFATPALCASAAGSTGCSTFMFSATYPSLECRCCAQAEPGISQPLWDVYTVSGLSSFSSVGILSPQYGSSPKLCSAVNCPIVGKLCWSPCAPCVLPLESASSSAAVGSAAFEVSRVTFAYFNRTDSAAVLLNPFQPDFAPALGFSETRWVDSSPSARFVTSAAARARMLSNASVGADSSTNTQQFAVLRDDGSFLGRGAGWLSEFGRYVKGCAATDLWCPVQVFNPMALSLEIQPFDATAISPTAPTQAVADADTDMHVVDAGTGTTFTVRAASELAPCAVTGTFAVAAQVDCGAHSAASCSACPTTGCAGGGDCGQAWCNGDCEWAASSSAGSCVPRGSGSERYYWTVNSGGVYRIELDRKVQSVWRIVSATTGERVILIFQLPAESPPVTITCGTAAVSRSTSENGTSVVVTLAARQQDQCTLTPVTRLILRTKIAVAIAQFSASIFEANLALALAVDAKYVGVISTQAGSTVVVAQVASNMSDSRLSDASLQRMANTLNSAASNGTLNLGYAWESFQAVGPFDREDDALVVVAPVASDAPTFLEKWKTQMIIMGSVALGLVAAICGVACVWLRCKNRKSKNAVIDSSALVNGVDARKQKGKSAWSAASPAVDSKSAPTSVDSKSGLPKQSLLQMVRLGNLPLGNLKDTKAVLLACSFRLLVGYFVAFPEHMKLQRLFQSSQARPGLPELLKRLALSDTPGAGPGMLPAPSACWNAYVRTRTLGMYSWHSAFGFVMGHSVASLRSAADVCVCVRERGRKREKERERRSERERGVTLQVRRLHRRCCVVLFPRRAPRPRTCASDRGRQNALGDRAAASNDNCRRRYGAAAQGASGSDRRHRRSGASSFPCAPMAAYAGIARARAHAHAHIDCSRGRACCVCACNLVRWSHLSYNVHLTIQRTPHTYVRGYEVSVERIVPSLPQVVRAAKCQPAEITDPIASACLAPADAGAPETVRAQRRQSLSAVLTLIIAEMLEPVDFACDKCQVASQISEKR
jgi:hypothetical protein